MSSDIDTEPFEAQLEGIYQEYRRQHLKEQLDDLAQTMEDTLLQQEIAEGFFDETVHIEDDVKTAVQETVEHLESGEYDSVEDDIDELTTKVSGAKTNVTNRIQQLRTDRQDTVSAMRGLNQRVERVDSTQVEALENLLENWNWKQHVYLESNDTFQERRTEAADYGENMKYIFESLKNDLFGVYDGTELRPLVEQLLDDERLRLAELSQREREQLAESDLGEYIEVKLS